MIKRCQLAVAALAASLSAAAAPTVQYDFGAPTTDEVQMLATINRARANPAAEGARLAATEVPSVVNAYRFFNVDLAKMRGDFASYPARPPLAWNKALITSAYNQSYYQISIRAQTHDRPPGQTFAGSFQDAGYTPFNGIAENVYAYSRSVWHGHAGLNVDWGGPDNDGDGMQDQLGHRKTLMDLEAKPQLYREIGIAVVPETDPSTELGPLVITQNFGFRIGTSYLTGTVYNDLNGNGEYDPGEGLGGVTVMPGAGTYYAVTAASGGYAIPLQQMTGAVTLTFSGGTLPQPLTRTLVLTTANRMVDVVNGQIVDGGPFDGFWGFDRGGENGWGRSRWMGWLIDEPSGWIYHAQHGWMLPARSSNTANLPIYDMTVGWLWTSDSFYPYFYHYGSARWLYYQSPSAAPNRWFYVYGPGGGWMQEGEMVL